MYLHQCDPNKCSGKKLEKKGYLKSIKPNITYKGILLSPNGRKYISREDIELVTKYGICVIDCSWNKIEQVPKKILNKGMIYEYN